MSSLIAGLIQPSQLKLNFSDTVISHFKPCRTWTHWETTKKIYKYHRGFVERGTAVQMNSSVISNNFGANIVCTHFPYLLFFCPGCQPAQFICCYCFLGLLSICVYACWRIVDVSLSSFFSVDIAIWDPWLCLV